MRPTIQEFCLEVVPLVGEFIEMADYGGASLSPTDLLNFTWDRWHDDNMFLDCQKNSDGRIIGCMCAVIIPSIFNASIKIASEIYWYVEEKSRGGSAASRMIRAYMTWAEPRNCLITMNSIDGASPENIDRAYRKLGFKLKERTYVKWPE